MPRDQPIALGLTKDRLTLGVGPWLFDFAVEDNLRFPDVDKVVPDAGAAPTRLRLDAGDIEALIHGLPRLPCDDDQHRPVTLDLGAAVAVRSRSKEGETSELVLAGSKKEGPAHQVAMDRRYLFRALKLGFTEILIASAARPVVCKDAVRTYVWMPLAEADAVPAPPAPRAGPARATAPALAARLETPRSTPAMPPNVPPTEPRPDGEHRNGSAGQGEPLDPISEAEELRVALQSALARTGRLISALKQERRQGRVVATALASLRRLQRP